MSTVEEGEEGGKDFVINLFIEYLLSTHFVLGTALCYDVRDTKMKRLSPCYPLGAHSSEGEAGL